MRLLGVISLILANGLTSVITKLIAVVINQANTSQQIKFRAKVVSR